MYNIRNRRITPPVCCPFLSDSVPGDADKDTSMTDEYARMNKTLRSAQVEDQILEYLLLSCKPGDKLPNEFELAKKFNTSRTTMREVMKSLASQGLVEIRHGSGTYVISTSPSTPDPLHLSSRKDKYRLTDRPKN